MPEGQNQLSILIIGAGSRGNAYASGLQQCENATSLHVGAIAEPIKTKRVIFKREYVRQHELCQLYKSWEGFVEFETGRQKREACGEDGSGAVDGVFVCALDEMPAEIITALAPLALHVLSKKPLAATFNDCLKIDKSL